MKECIKCGCKNVPLLNVGLNRGVACRSCISWFDPTYMPNWWFILSACSLGLSFGLAIAALICIVMGVF
jgi:hypothetical protein